MERPVLGREFKNTGSISLFPNSKRRRRRCKINYVLFYGYFLSLKLTD
jgi:hypothetical protein